MQREQGQRLAWHYQTVGPHGRKQRTLQPATRAAESRRGPPSRQGLPDIHTCGQEGEQTRAELPTDSGPEGVRPGSGESGIETNGTGQQVGAVFFVFDGGLIQLAMSNWELSEEAEGGYASHRGHGDTEFFRTQRRAGARGEGTEETEGEGERGKEVFMPHTESTEDTEFFGTQRRAGARQRGHRAGRERAKRRGGEGGVLCLTQRARRHREVA